MNKNLNQISEEREWQIFELLEGNLNKQQSTLLLEEIKQNPAEWKFYQEMKLTYLNSAFASETNPDRESESENESSNLYIHNPSSEFVFPNKKKLLTIPNTSSSSTSRLGFIKQRNLQQWSIAATILLILGIAAFFKTQSIVDPTNKNLHTTTIPSNTNQSRNKNNPSQKNTNSSPSTLELINPKTRVNTLAKLKTNAVNSIRIQNNQPSSSTMINVSKTVTHTEPLNFLNSLRKQKTSPDKINQSSSIIRPIQIAASNNPSQIQSNEKGIPYEPGPLNRISQSNDPHAAISSSEDRDIKVIYASHVTDEIYKKEIQSIKKQWLKEAAQELRYGRLPEIRLSARKQKNTWVPEVGLNVASKSVVMHTTLVQH